MRLVNITNKPHVEAQRVDFILRPEGTEEYLQAPAEEQQMADSKEQVEPQLTPQQAAQLVSLIEYSRRYKDLYP